jgi:hypothetical protein
MRERKARASSEKQARHAPCALFPFQRVPAKRRSGVAIVRRVQSAAIGAAAPSHFA